MNDFEKQIREAMVRKEPPEGFESRVLAAAGRSDERRRWWSAPFIGRLRWASAMAVVVVAITAITWQHQRAVEERSAGEAAKARLERALRITSVKLNRIQEKVEAHQNN